MKSTILILTICVSLFSSCKSKKDINASSTSSANQTTASSKTNGKVSHQYRSTGCATVVIVMMEGEENPLTLIPKDKLSDNFDVDGMEISFNYRTLRMPQPEGCSKGIPAELTDITKK